MTMRHIPQRLNHQLGAFVKAGVRYRHGALSALWRSLENHRRHLGESRNHYNS
jgi:hypothetical protein